MVRNITSGIVGIALDERGRAQPPGNTLRHRAISYRRLGLKGNLLGDIAAFVIPCLMFAEVDLIGRLFLPEIILLFLLPFLLMAREGVVAVPMPRIAVFLGLAWLLSQVITDLIRATPFVDWSRGWCKILFFLANFAALHLLISWRESRVIIFVAGCVVGQILQYYISPSEFASYYPWKFGIGGAVTLFLVLLAQLESVRGMPLLPELLLCFGSGLNLYMGYRSLAGICFLAAAYLSAQRILGMRELTAQAKWGGRGLALLVMVFLGGLALASLYGYAANNGWLGEEATREYESQASGRFGVLVGGRKEILASSLAIIDSPLIGHGSWARDSRYVALMEEQLRLFDYDVATDTLEDLIPSHSYLFGAWVEAGLMGAVFWFWVLALTVRVLASCGLKTYLSPLVAFAGFSLLWNILFSPFGAGERLYAAYYLNVLMAAREGMRQLS